MFRCSKFMPTHEDGRDKISAEKAFLISCWYLGNAESFRSISDRFNVTISSAHRCFQRVLNFLLSIKSTIIKWPTNAEAAEIVEGFRKIKGIDGVLGTIYSSHVEIAKPSKNPSVYVNQKGYHSIRVQGILDHTKKFIDVYCGEPGSMHDAKLLRKSEIYTKVINNPQFFGNNFLIGHSAYPNLSWLVTPFEDNGELTPNQIEFNSNLSATRVVADQSFGLLKGRFQRLRKLDNIDILLCSKIIMGACILHNMCIDEKDFIETEESDFNQPEQPSRSSAKDVDVNKRQELFNSIYNT